MHYTTWLAFEMPTVCVGADNILAPLCSAGAIDCSLVRRSIEKNSYKIRHRPLERSVMHCDGELDNF